MSQYYEMGPEACQLPPEREVAGSLPMAPPRDAPVTSAISRAGTSQLPIFASGHPPPTNLSDPPEVSDAATQAAQMFEGSYQPNPKDHVTATCYPFVDTDFMSRIPVEDLNYLDHLGCLQLPQPNDLDEIVRAYFLYIHPHLPLIDEGKFWDTYLNRQVGSGVRNPSRIPLFVFQAILLTACSVSSGPTPIPYNFLPYSSEMLLCIF